MKKRIILILTILMLIAGVSSLLYPTVSNWVTIRFRELEIVHYDEAVEQMDPELVAAEMKKARAYNDALVGANIEDPFIPGSGIVLPEGYAYVLNVGGTIGYVDIPKIDVYLPIHHGTSEGVLQKGVGHLQNTAFPIGGKGTHAVLTGHTGLSSARLFTDLTELKIGDVFYITVLDQTLAYGVNQILVVEPSDTEELRPVKGEDYVTLVTCTPYAVNSHRLLVRGMSIPYTEEREKAPEGGTLRWSDWWTMIIMTVILITTAVAVYILMRRRRNQKNGSKRRND